jgi:hypothetical protein
LAYSPVAKRFLIPWYDRHASGNTPFGEAPSDIKATLYGMSEAPTTTTTSVCPTEQIYGEYAEETERLRYLRDNVLGQTPEGQEIIRLYYEWSPAIVVAMEKDEGVKEGMKGMIDGFLELLGGRVE